ncbi:MAG: YkgJ family cysteine cluster protein [Thermodesulfobacteriota bacterium]|nr:YkgJ family cysteine cluster protein [Thermodesulfobacteriota bacterium]
MALDFKEHFAKYEALVSMVDGVFERVRNEYPKEVFCREKCSDCCYAIFDLTIIEAIYLNHKFNEKFSGAEKFELINEAAKIDRALHKLKKEASQEIKKGKNEVDILGMMASKRMRCPLLGPDNLCILYEARPITCRLYGIPTSSAGMSHICGRTNFEEGKKYPTVNMDTIYSQLQLISAELTKALKSKHVKMCEMLVPVSSAMITIFNEEYLGVEA